MMKDAILHLNKIKNITMIGVKKTMLINTMTILYLNTI